MPHPVAASLLNSGIRFSSRIEGTPTIRISPDCPPLQVRKERLLHQTDDIVSTTEFLLRFSSFTSVVLCVFTCTFHLHLHSVRMESLTSIKPAKNTHAKNSKVPLKRSRIITQDRSLNKILFPAQSLLTQADSMADPHPITKLNSPFESTKLLCPDKPVMKRKSIQLSI